MKKLSAPPTQITAGDSLEWEYPLPEMAAADVAMKCAFVCPTGGLTVEGVVAGDVATFTLDSTATATMAGEYRWQISAQSSGWSAAVAGGRMVVAADLFGKVATGHDGRSWLDRAIEALQASIAGRADKVQLEMSFDNLAIKNMSQLEQLDLLDRLEKRRAAEQLAADRASGRHKGVGRLIKVEFG